MARKRPRPFCAKCRWHFTPTHAYALNPTKSEWAYYAASVGTYPGNELTRNLSGSTQSQSSQLAEPLWTDPGLKSGTTVSKLISTLKRERERRTGGERIVKHSTKILAHKEKATTTTTPAGENIHGTLQRIHYKGIQLQQASPQAHNILKKQFYLNAEHTDRKIWPKCAELKGIISPGNVLQL